MKECSLEELIKANNMTTDYLLICYPLERVPKLLAECKAGLKVPVIL